MQDTVTTPDTSAAPSSSAIISAPSGAVNRHSTRDPRAPRLDLQPSLGALLARLVLSAQEIEHQIEALGNRVYRDADAGTLTSGAAQALAMHLLGMAGDSTRLTHTARTALRDLATRKAPQPVGVIRLVIPGEGAVLGLMSFTQAEGGRS